MRDKELLYHIIDWGLAVLLAVYPLSQQKYIITFLIILTASAISIIGVLHFKNGRLQNRLQSYELLLGFPIPLYGIISYLFNQNKRKQEYQNSQIHLKELALSVKLVGDIQKNKNNDLEYSWTFNGKNNSNVNVGNLYLRIGGDSAYDLNSLNIKCVDCAVAPQNCKFRDNLRSCKIEKECISSYSPYFTAVNGVDVQTTFLLDINFVKSVAPLDDIKIKCSYVWPQCYNMHSDYLLIDPNNFAPTVEQIHICVFCDGIVIKKESKVQLYSIDRSLNKLVPEGQVLFNKTDNLFEYTIQPGGDRVYFVLIENN